MNRRILLIVVLLAPLLLWFGCEPQDPGSPLANQPPDTRIVVAPLEGSEHDHYISPSDMFRVQWFGHDPDGYITGYWVQVDNGPMAWIVRGDSIMSFESSTVDPSDPTKTLPMAHTIKVTAVDNENALDPTPAARTFSAVNDIPEILEFTTEFEDGDTVGAGLAFSVSAIDANPSGVMVQVSVDGNSVTEWDSRSQFQFCDVSDPSVLESIDEGAIYPIDVSSLTAGSHVLSVAVRDLGGAVSPDMSLNIFVVDTLKPEVTGVAARYGTAQFYVDGSIFYAPNRTTTITISASAEEYFGSVSGYRYRYFSKQISDDNWVDSTSWSEWGSAEVMFSNMNRGEYLFELKCRDYTGAESEVSTYSMSLVEADFSQRNLLVVDETRDGNGNLGSPDDADCDIIYREILDYDTLNYTTSTGWKASEIDYVTHKVGEVKYVSPRDVFDKRIIVWHADDKSVIELGNNERILSEYLTRGGRLILSGHDVMGAFTANDSGSFTGFAANYLRISGGKRDVARNSVRGFIGMEGMEGYPTLDLDHDKKNARWAGLDRCWVLVPSRRTDVLGLWRGSDNTTSYEGGSCCIRNFHPAINWKTITLGFPLYFMQTDQAKAFMTKAIEEIDQ